MIGVVVMGLLLIVAASEEERKEATSESDRSKRQYHARRPAVSSRNPSHLLEIYEEDEGVVQYDPSGLGFEIQKPGSFQYQYRPSFHTEPIKPAAYSQPKPTYDLKPDPILFRPDPPKPAYPEPKPIYPEPKPAYRPAYPEPKPYYPERKPAYKPDGPYPVDPYPPKYGDYRADYSYYCPKVAGYEAQCRPLKDCSIWYDSVLSTPATTCKLVDGHPGACCPSLPYNGNLKNTTI